ncbi:MAG: DNA replication/repair protein RecF [Crocinitomicaceae bacterium]|nr:DNA replication/repair protein RecF [Crocinitomicaceae bacterium]
MSYLKKIYLENFRNYKQAQVIFSPKVNLLLGENGQGKSNILESIYFLSLLRSFRTNRIRHLQSWRSQQMLLRAHIEHDEKQEDILGIEYLKDKRKLRLNGDNVTRASQFIQQILGICFVPEDIELIKGSASERRRFLNITLSQFDPVYLQISHQYELALQSRNKLLRKENLSASVLAAFDQQLIEYGIQIFQVRYHFLKTYCPQLEDVVRHLYPENNQLQLKYIPSGLDLHDENIDNGQSLAQQFKEQLQQDFERDCKRGITHSGPHRDEMAISLNGKLLQYFGSEGQCRLAAIALKIAKTNLIEQYTTPQTTVLLVDDVIGELDLRSRNAFFDFIQNKGQIFIAATEIDSIPESLQPKIFHIRNGEISQG